MLGMKSTAWILLIFTIVLWFFFQKFWFSAEPNFVFFDRNKTMVFPTQKTETLDPFVTPTIIITPLVTPLPKVGTDTSSIKF